MIKTLFTGDFCPDHLSGFEKKVIEKGELIFGDSLKLIKSVDLSFVNLECPLTSSSKPINKIGKLRKCNPNCSDALVSFTLLGLANNHILDYGKEGLKETIKTCNDKGLSYVGAGLNIEDAQKPFYKVIKGIKFAIIAIAEHEFNQSENGKEGSAPIDLIENYKQIKEAKANSDTVILTLHGGNEFFPYPRPGLRKICLPSI